MASMTVCGNGKSPRAAGFFLFLLSILRIAIPGGFRARFPQEFWRGSSFVSEIVTFVRAGGGLTKFPQSGGKGQIQLKTG